MKALAASDAGQRRTLVRVAVIRRRKPRTVRDVLNGLGLSAEAIEEAERAGTDELLAIDAVVLPERGKFTLEELADKVDADVAVIQAFWRALGFVDAVDGERSFNKRDVAILKSLVELTASGIVNHDVALQVARVVGLSMAQVATAVMDAGADRAGQRREIAAGGDASAIAEYDAGSLAVRAGDLLPFMTDVIDYSFRRHLRAAARRRVVLADSEGGETQVVGFADLVRFTELSLQLDDHELNELVGRFDRLVNAVVVGQGGRIVKMIGDAAMFAVVGPVQAGLVALELSEAVARDEQMGGLRIGMASGPALARDGDLYGPVVNVASRLGTIGRAGAVNVSQSLRDAIAADPRFSLRSLGERRLRHIGDVRVYRLRPGPAWTTTNA
ncbi:MAG: adenylate/guanylate cyclase domain-containing protein [Ilumatobacter sp.]|nr:adenylate/guanylate cyclase domain-containing protein [Ilumatobacter sp.]